MFLFYFTGIADLIPHLLDAELFRALPGFVFQTFDGFSLFIKLQYDGFFYNNFIYLFICLSEKISNFFSQYQSIFL